MGWMVRATAWPLEPRKIDPVPILQEDGCVPGSKWTGFDSRTFHSIASRYSDHVIPAHINQKRLYLPVKYIQLA